MKKLDCLTVSYCIRSLSNNFEVSEIGEKLI